MRAWIFAALLVCAPATALAQSGDPEAHLAICANKTAGEPGFDQCVASVIASRVIIDIAGAQAPQTLDEVRARSRLQWTQDGDVWRYQLPGNVSAEAGPFEGLSLSFATERREEFDVVASLRRSGATVTAIGCTPEGLPGGYMGVYRVSARGLAPVEFWVSTLRREGRPDAYIVRAKLGGRIMSFDELQAEVPGVVQQCR